MSKEHDKNHAHPVPLKYLLGVWAFLIVLTVVTVAVAGLHLEGGLGIFVAMGIAAVKSIAVALIFMHLLWDKGINSFILISSLLFVFLFISFALLDTREYHDDLIVGYAPAITGSVTGAAEAEGETLTGIARGEQLYATTCVVCHGPNAEGNQQLGAPALHHQSSWYIVNQLNVFRDGHRGTKAEDIFGVQMRPMAVALPDEAALEDVAEYISSLEAPLPPTTFEADTEAGKSFYNSVCVACHGLDGMGMPALQSPALVGQHDWYMRSQLHNFRGELRGYALEDQTGLQMKAMALAIPSDEMVDNIVAYVARLGR